MRKSDRSFIRSQLLQQRLPRLNLLLQLLDAIALDQFLIHKLLLLSIVLGLLPARCRDAS
ncbi:hypothetical protein [Trichocoleus sp. DQ-U1]|uniref:hypothetical protein n=1 Tax=Trichocoleus sp. DQ-U1 TaxID=2933926 RepID=UPI0032997D21